MSIKIPFRAQLFAGGKYWRIENGKYLKFTMNGWVPADKEDFDTIFPLKGCSDYALIEAGAE